MLPEVPGHPGIRVTCIRLSHPIQAWPVNDNAFATVRLAYPSGSFFPRSRARISSFRRISSGSLPCSTEPHTHPHSRPESEASFPPAPVKGLFDEPRRPPRGGEEAEVGSLDRFTSGKEMRFTQVPCRFQFRNPGKRPKCSPETDPGSPIPRETTLDCSRYRSSLDSGRSVRIQAWWRPGEVSMIHDWYFRAIPRVYWFVRSSRKITGQEPSCAGLKYTSLPRVFSARRNGRVLLMSSGSRDCRSR